jgi:hypothetical protein
MYLDFVGNGIIEEMKHVGRTGMFVPVVDNGGTLYRVKDGKSYAVTGTKGYQWVEASVARETDDLVTDASYFINLTQKAQEAIENFGSFEAFVN